MRSLSYSIVEGFKHAFIPNFSSFADGWEINGLELQFLVNQGI